MTRNQPLPSCSVAVSKAPNLSYGDEFDTQDNEHRNSFLSLEFQTLMACVSVNEKEAIYEHTDLFQFILGNTSLLANSFC